MGVGHDRDSWRKSWRGPVLACVVGTLLSSAWAADLRYLTIGTGPPGESYFPMGGLIASAISNPPGSRPCDRGGSCGVPNLIAVASATTGSVANLEAIRDGRLDIAIVQSDVAMWACQGIGPFQGRPASNLRSIANLYPNQLHLVARADARIRSPRDLKGKRVSFGEMGSGTLLHARQVIAAWSVKENEIKAQFMRSALAADAMLAGNLDAFFVVDRAPIPSVAELAKRLPIALVPISGDGADRLKRSDTLLLSSEIAGGLYEGVPDDVATLEVGVSLVASADLSEALVLGITRALWNPTTTAMLAESLSQGTRVKLATALVSLGAPLHPGASRFYTDNNVAQ